MSHHYSASQFDHAFKPIRLNVYTPFTNMPCPPHGIHAMCLPNRCSSTKIIGDHNGRMFDCICRGPSSPWGDYSTSTLDDSYDCSCVPQLRRPEERCCDPPPQAQKCIYVSKPECKVKKCEAAPCAHATIRIGDDDRGGGGDCGGKRIPDKLKKILSNKEKRCKMKLAQVCKKKELDLIFDLKRHEIFAKANLPSKCVDWSVVRKQNWDPDGGKRKKPLRPACPPLNSCCCNRFPGQYLTCPSLNNENYIRRY